MEESQQKVHQTLKKIISLRKIEVKFRLLPEGFKF